MEFNKYRVQKVQLQCSDPNERYYWVVFDEKLIKDNKKGWYGSSSMIYDTTEKKLYAWTLFPNSVNNILDGYVDNSGDRIFLYEANSRSVVKWFIKDIDKNSQYIEKAIIDATI